jgi:UDP-N-acetylmuramate--alanine ligase
VGWAARKLHFVGIGGAGMSGLALVCRELGAAVSGSDRTESAYVERLRAAGLAPTVGHDPESVPEDAEVVVSTAIPDDNPELASARGRGQRIVHRGELLAEVCREKRLLAVAGTHGKTTTAGMAVHCLRAAGADPAFVLGGELPLGGGRTNAAWGAGEWIVAEADESDASFLALRPEVCVITNIELEHHARWGSLSALRRAFAEFVGPARAAAVWREGELGEVRPSGGEAVTFGLEGADRTAEAIEARSDGGIAFTLRGGPADGARVELAVPGRHNVLDALAALTALELAGHDPGKAGRALAAFTGMARRFELVGARDGVVVYDDYAHHPTEVAATLEAARQLRPDRLVAVFQPHLYSRTKELAAQFGRALAAADVVCVLDVYPAREQPVGPLAGVSGRMVAEAAADAAGGRTVWWLPDAGQAERALARELRAGDIVLTLGAGDVDQLAERLVRSS